MKTRLQVQLETEDYRALKSWARWRGISMSAVIRWLIQEHLRERLERSDPAIQRFLAAAGSIPDAPGEGDVSRDHDHYLYD